MSIRTLEPFLTGGRLGHVLDHAYDDLADSTEQFMTFEQRTLLNLPDLVGPTLSAIFHRLEKRFSTLTPSLIPMDEWAVTSAIPDIAKNGKEWLMTRAKKRVSLGMATHSLAQMFGDRDNELGALMIEGCKQKYVLPNSEARTPEMAEIYERLGYNDHDRAIIASAIPQRQVYYSCELTGKGLIDLPLSPVTLAIVARNKQEHHDKMDDLLARVGLEDFGDGVVAVGGIS